MTEAKSDTPPAKKLGTHLCDRCGEKIECTSKDPGHSTTEGIFHGVCMKKHYQELRNKEAAKEAKKKPAKEVEE